jgi:hypothetical protein
MVSLAKLLNFPYKKTSQQPRTITSVFANFSISFFFSLFPTILFPHLKKNFSSDFYLEIVAAVHETAAGRDAASAFGFGTSDFVRCKFFEGDYTRFFKLKKKRQALKICASLFIILK